MPTKPDPLQAYRDLHKEVIRISKEYGVPPEDLLDIVSRQFSIKAGSQQSETDIAAMAEKAIRTYTGLTI